NEGDVKFLLDDVDDFLLELQQIGGAPRMLIDEHEWLSGPGGHAGFLIVYVLEAGLLDKPGGGQLDGASADRPVRDGIVVVCQIAVLLLGDDGVGEEGADIMYKCRIGQFGARDTENGLPDDGRGKGRNFSG